jgi:hypothetical protein
VYRDDPKRHYGSAFLTHPHLLSVTFVSPYIVFRNPQWHIKECNSQHANRVLGYN